MYRVGQLATSRRLARSGPCPYRPTASHGVSTAMEVKVRYDDSWADLAEGPDEPAKRCLDGEWRSVEEPLAPGLYFSRLVPGTCEVDEDGGYDHTPEHVETTMVTVAMKRAAQKPRPCSRPRALIRARRWGRSRRVTRRARASRGSPGRSSDDPEPGSSRRGHAASCGGAS